MTETRKPAPVQRDGQAPTNRKEKQMQDNNTPETFAEAKARLEKIMREGDLRGLTPLWEVRNSYEGIHAAITVPASWAHPRAGLLPSGIARVITVTHPTEAEAMSALADLAAEASQMRGAA